MKHGSVRKKKNITPYLFISPVLIILVALVVYPICYAFFLSVMGSMEKMAEDALASGSPQNTRKSVDKDVILSLYRGLWE